MKSFQRTLHKKVRQAGLTLLEVLLSVGILSMVVVGAASLSNLYSDTVISNDYALLIKSIGEAGAEYIQDKAPEINKAFSDNNIPTTTPYLITMSDLTGYFDQGSQPSNTYKHDICILVLKPNVNAEKLDAILVTEGGEKIDDISLGETTATIGAMGGGIFKDKPDIIQGAMNGWKYERTTSAFFKPNFQQKKCNGDAGNIVFEQGHAYMALWSAKKLRDSVLHTNYAPNNPSFNTMNTPILMGGGAIHDEEDSCEGTGTPAAIARDANGRVLYCDSYLDNVSNTTKRIWRAVGERYWAEPVKTYDELPLCNASKMNQTRVVENPNLGGGTGRRAYTCNVTTSLWEALALDKDGDLKLNKLTSQTIQNSGDINNIGNISTKNLDATVQVKAGKVNLIDADAVENTPCPTLGLVSHNEKGLLLWCQQTTEGLIWKSSDTAGPLKPAYVEVTCHAANNTDNACSKDAYAMLNLSHYHINRGDLRLDGIPQRTSCSNDGGDGCGANAFVCYFSNGVLHLSVNQSFQTCVAYVTW